MNSRFAPFIHTEKTAPVIYMNVMISLMPCVIASVVFYGIRAILLILSSILIFFLSDMLFSKLLRSKSGNRDYIDLSSLISGTVFALLLPPDTSFAVVLAGALFGSVVIKQVFGGVGSNILNPAIASRLFVALLMPGMLKGFRDPLGDWFSVGGFFSLKPISSSVTDISSLYMSEIITGKIPSCIGAGCGVLILIGAAYLLIKRLVRGYAFFGYMGAVIILYPLLHMSDVFKSGGLRELLVFVLSSGVIFIATYALGDFTTMPINPLMRMMSGMICAFMTLFLYGKVDHMVSLCTPVLIINLLTPSLDFFTSTLSHREDPV